MADSQRSGVTAERDIEQAIMALKKGSYLLKYGRRGKPKFCPFNLSNDETTLIWYSGKEEKQLKLDQVSKIIPGQRTAIFQRYPRPEKEYQSFSLICNDRTLDLICKDKDEAEIWFVGLKALTARLNFRKRRNDLVNGSISSGSPHSHTQRRSPSAMPFETSEVQVPQIQTESPSASRLGKAFSDIVSYTAAAKGNGQADPVASSLEVVSTGVADDSSSRNSTTETFRISISSALSSSSQGSCREDFDSLGDVFIWGEGVGDGDFSGGQQKQGFPSKKDTLLPKPLESGVVLDVHQIGCGYNHALLVNRQGEIFSWGKDLGGRLGHGTECDVSQPKLINSLGGISIEQIACGEYHSCAITTSGDLYTWGDGIHNSGVLGHGSQVSNWIPRRVGGQLDSLRISYVACGPWHTAAVTSSGQLFTFGDGSFGALGHGDLNQSTVPREVEALKGLRTIRVACGVWHTAAVVEAKNGTPFELLSRPAWGILYTWGDGDKGRLGHGDGRSRLIPERVAPLADENICRVACGHNLTVALTSAGTIHTMGSAAYGQLGNSQADGRSPVCVEGNINDCFVEDISCGSHHVAAITSTDEVFTWGKGSNGQLGHGDSSNRIVPTIVGFLRDKQVKSVCCGANFTAVICVHKLITGIDHSICSGCQCPFGFRRKRHNCYNCGLVFCKACSSRRSLKASLAPNMTKPYRVCDDCFAKLQKSMVSGSSICLPKVQTDAVRSKSDYIRSKASARAKSQTQISRIFTATEIFGLTEEKHPIPDLKVGANGGRVFPLTNRIAPSEGVNASKELSFAAVPTKLKSISVPVSTVPSRSVSPLSVKSSPPRFSEVMNDDTKDSPASVGEELAHLRARVEDLTLRSRELENELEKTKRQLKEVSEVAEHEALKCRSAKEVIKTLTAQLKESPERLPKGQRVGQNSRSVIRHSASESNVVTVEHKLEKPQSPETEPSVRSSSPSSGTRNHFERAERVIQEEPGVYITLSPLPDGGNEMKRIRFSRKHFTEQQAEVWWAAHGAKIFERYDIREHSTA
ncbi:hypothetical protein MLD38_037927 [Melastoma candidum]|uniref:Uncharacterized protein n=1 Tax=Melastoma candidum TaxID=119954 RepID=A0ACB9KZN9_9MYRT|nr:hypothetical protein MLD38_037927 [Melastoma candidum]